MLGIVTGLPQGALLSYFKHPLRLLRDRRGQDLIEYALLAAFLAVAVAGFFPTDIAPSISTVFSKIVVILDAA